ncbi:MAG: MFS transporter [Sphingobacteriales bacterium]|nr:MFS transporter [Sphingobacteriales bacterium]
MSNYRWTICTLLFFATTINYLDRQVLSLTWKDFLVPEFHWTNSDYGTVTAFFSIVYAITMLFAGKLIDYFDTKKGFLWAIGIWSVGACLHALCGIATAGFIRAEWLLSFAKAKTIIAAVSNTAQVASVSVWLFVMARTVLAIGEAGNFPAAVKATAEYFPKRIRAFATSIFNAGTAVGALMATLSIPFIASAYGWEITFVIIGALGFIWMFFWNNFYKKPHLNSKVNQQELAYIQQDETSDNKETVVAEIKKLSLLKAFSYKQTWAICIAKFLTDGVWFFFLFWAPAYISSVFHLKSTQSAPQLLVVYLLTLLSIFGGWLPTWFITKKKMNPYDGRMKAMFIFAFIPLLTFFAQPLATYSIWLPVIIIGIACAGHQSWSANVYTIAGDLFPKSAVATIIGIGGMAGGLSSFIINKGSGVLFDYAQKTNMKFMGFTGIEAGYFIVFIFCAFAYLIAWFIMKTLLPEYKPVEY